MSPLSSALQITITLLGLVLFVGAFAMGEVMWGFGVLSFVGVAFCSLKFSSIDPTAKSPEAKRWFISGLIFGTVSVLILLLSAVIEIADGNLKSAARLLIYLPLLVYVWRTYGRGLKAVIANRSDNQ